MSQGTAGLMIAAACFLPGNASAFGATLHFNDRVASAPVIQSVEAGLPCPSGHNWQAADSTQDSARQKSGRPNATARVSGKTASTSKTSKSGNDKTIIFVGGKKAQANTKAPTASANARTGELRHNQSNIRREEKK
jgi:hypothetical protein